MANILPQHTIKTVDEKHNEMMAKFAEIDANQQPEWKVRCTEIKQTLKYLQPEWDGVSPLLLHDERIFKLKMELDETKKKIQTHEQNKKKYALENANFIFNYFEEKKNISANEPTAETKESKRRDILLDFFDANCRKKNKQKQALEHKLTAQTLNEHSYWKNVCEEIPDIQDYVFSAEICGQCFTGEYIFNEEEGTYNCKSCGHFTQQYVNTPKYFNGDVPNDVTYTTYDRLIHFKEIMSQFQAKETTKIPDEIVRNIANRIRKERITDLSEIDYDKMRDILKTLGYNRYFEHIQLINSIFGIKPPQMDKELYDTLCILFMETRHPWALFCPPNRTNFFNYTYVLYQLCVLLKQYQFLPFIPMMKDPKKRLNMDIIWKQLCDYLDWEYIPSPH